MVAPISVFCRTGFNCVRGSLQKKIRFQKRKGVSLWFVFIVLSHTQLAITLPFLVSYVRGKKFGLVEVSLSD